MKREYSISIEYSSVVVVVVVESVDVFLAFVVVVFVAAFCSLLYTKWNTKSNKDEYRDELVHLQESSLLLWK